LHNQKWKLILVKKFTKSLWLNDIIQNISKNRVRAKSSTCDNFCEAHFMFSLICLNNNLLVVGALCFQLLSSICSFWFCSHVSRLHIFILHFLKHWKFLNMKHLMLQLLTICLVMLFWWPNPFLHTNVYKTSYVDMCGW